jgi:hypothetical protein
VFYSWLGWRAGPPPVVVAHEVPHMTDRAFPMGFVVAAAFASGLVWLSALLGHLALP